MTDKTRLESIRSQTGPNAPLNRRSFVARTSLLAGAVTVWKGGRAVVEAAPAAGPARRLYELGTVTYNLGRNWDLDRLLEMCEKTDFRAVELRTTHRHEVEPELTGEQRREVRRRFERTPVKLICLGTACEFHSPEREEVQRNIELTNRFIELAADVGAPGVKVRPNGIPGGVPVETTLRQIGRALQEVARTAEKHQVGVWMEVHGRESSHPLHVKKMIDYCGHPLVGVTWNSNRTDLKDGSVRPYFELLRPHIQNVHINELHSEYPYEELFALLRETGYDAYTLAEVPEAEGDPERFMRYYRKLWEALSRPCG